MASLYNPFLADLNQIEQELNSKCQSLLDGIVDQRKRMQSKIASLRQNFISSQKSGKFDCVRAKLNFDIEAFLSTISSAMSLDMKVEEKVPPKFEPPMREEKFRLPKELAIHPTTGSIYVADLGNECVKVCDSSGTIIGTLGEGILREPHGILILSRTLYVTDTHLNSIFEFDLYTHSLRHKVRHVGKDFSELGKPKGLAIDQDAFIYVCDSKNNRVLVLKKDLEFLKALSWDNINKQVNIRFANGKMYLLCEMNPCLFIMDHAGEQKAVIRNGYSFTVMTTGFFCVDQEENVYISCYGGVIHKFDKNAQILDKHVAVIAKETSMKQCFYGVGVNSHGKVVAVSTRPYVINFLDF